MTRDKPNTVGLGKCIGKIQQHCDGWTKHFTAHETEGHDDGIDDEEEDYGDRFEYEPNTTVAFERIMDSLALNVGELQDTLDL